MKIVHLDTVGGIAGDMVIAGFVNAGLPLDELTAELQKLPISGFELLGKHVRRSNIGAVHIEVVISGQQRHHRHLKDISALIDESTLSQRTRECAKSIFHTIAEAEARVHISTAEKVHFHEVGALDSIIDIVGTAICLEKFGIEKVFSSPVKLGSGGTVNTQHGRMPTPTPATLEILRNYPTVLTGIPHELTTPTGAAIIKTLSHGILSDEQIIVEQIGYGAGTHEFAEIPNLLRVIIGEMRSAAEEETILLVETNIDDMNPQVYPHLLEKLLASGAHDAYIIPIIMKKGRPGVLLSVMTGRDRLDEIERLIYGNTSTIGLRIHTVDRKKLPRRQEHIQTTFGTVLTKVVIRNGKETVAPEFEECKRIAEERNLPVLEVLRRLERELESPISKNT